MKYFSSIKQKPILFFIFAIISFFYGFDPLMRSSMQSIVDPLIKTFHTNTLGIGLISASYLYAYVLMQIPFGILMDIIRFKTLFLISLGMCIVGLIMFSLSTNIELLYISRAIMGAFAASSTIIGFGTVLRYFPIMSAPIFIGIIQFCGNIGDMISGYPLGSIVNVVGWRLSMLSISLIGIIIFILVYILLPKDIKHIEIKTKPFFEQLKSIKKNILNKQVIICLCYAFFIWTPVQLFAGLWGTSAIALKYHISISESAGIVSTTWLGVGIGSIVIGFIASYLKSYKIPLLIFTVTGLIFAFLLFNNNFWLIPISCWYRSQYLYGL